MRHIFFVEQKDRSCCSPRRYVFLLSKKTLFCWTRKQVFLLSKKACPLVQENMSSCSARRHVFLLNKRAGLLVQQEGMSFLWARDHVLPFGKYTGSLVEQEDLFFWKGRHSFMERPYTLYLFPQVERPDMLFVNTFLLHPMLEFMHPVPQGKFKYRRTKTSHKMCSAHMTFQNAFIQICLPVACFSGCIIVISKCLWAWVVITNMTLYDG